MANGWTPERRALQSALIRTWKPWNSATGPASAEGKAKVARNAYAGGQRLELRRIANTLRQQREGVQQAVWLRSIKDKTGVQTGVQIPNSK